MLLIGLLYLQCPISWEQSVLSIVLLREREKKEFIIKCFEETFNPDGTTVNCFTRKHYSPIQLFCIKLCKY